MKVFHTFNRYLPTVFIHEHVLSIILGTEVVRCRISSCPYRVKSGIAGVLREVRDWVTWAVGLWVIWGLGASEGIPCLRK